MTARRLLLVPAALLLSVLLPAAAQAVTAANNIANAPAITGAGPHAVAYDTDGATLESGEPNHWNADYGASVWVRWTPTATVNMRMDNCGDNGSVGTKVRIYEGPSSGVTMAKLYPLTDTPEAGDIPYNTCEANIQTLKAQANQTYYIAVVRSKYMGYADPGGTLEIEQSTVKPVVTFKNPPTQFGANVKIEFSSPKNVDYTCKLDGSPVYCSSNGDNGWWQQGFADHKTHLLTVVARNQFLTSGNAYTWAFTADGVAPDTFITSKAPTALGPYAVLFHASEVGTTFKCQLVGETQPEPCTSPWTIQQTAYVGGHTVRVIASDKWGNADKTPADQKVYVTYPPAPPKPQQPVVQQQAPVVQQQAPVVQQQAPVVQQQTPVVQQQTPPAPVGPCVTKARHGRLTKRGMRVQIAGDPGRFCIVTVELRAGRRLLARQVRPIAAGRSLTLVMKPRIKAPKGARVRLVTAAR